MTGRRRIMLAVAATAAVVAGVVGCGLGIQSPDLFELTRTGQGETTTLLINDGGSIRCNDRAPRPLAEPLLLQARDLAMSLSADAKAHLRLPPTRGSAFQYKIKLQDGTISFPDTAGASHSELARAELFAVKAARDGCGLKG